MLFVIFCPLSFPIKDASYVDGFLGFHDVLVYWNESTLYNFEFVHPRCVYVNKGVSFQINYLDITIKRKDDHVDISVYGKPTYTDSIVPHTSNHPAPHKYAAVRYLYNRLNTYHLNSEHYLQELHTIQNILYNNRFSIHKHTHPKPKHNNNTTNIEPQQQNNKKWVKFTYVAKETTLITKIFKGTDLRVAHHTTNTLQKH
jgi:hypothetical protein